MQGCQKAVFPYFAYICVAAGVGVTADTLDRMQALVDAGADAIVIDTAHGHSMYVIEKLKEAKKRFPNIDIVVGERYSLGMTNRDPPRCWWKSTGHGLQG